MAQKPTTCETKRRAPNRDDAETMCRNGVRGCHLGGVRVNLWKTEEVSYIQTVGFSSTRGASGGSRSRRREIQPSANGSPPGADGMNNGELKTVNQIGSRMRFAVTLEWRPRGPCK